MDLLKLHDGVRVLNVLQRFSPNAVERSGDRDAHALREQFGIYKSRADSHETSGTGLAGPRFSTAADRQTEDVDRPAVGVVGHADDSSAPDDDRTTRAIGVGLDLVEGNLLRLFAQVS